MKIPRSFVSPLKSLSLIALTLALSIAVQTSALSTWIPATASAPGGNVSTPLNTGLNTQSKLGGLFLNTSNTQPFDIGLSVFGKTVLNGDVVIATGSPAIGKVLTSVDNNGTVGWGVGGGTASVGTCSASPYVAAMTSGTTYQNTSGTQLIVVATASESSTNGQQWLQGYIGASSASTLVSNDVFLSPNTASITFVVPPGYYYKVVNQASNSPTLNSQAWQVCGGSGTTGGASWVDVPVTDTTTPFDQACEYRIRVTTNGDYSSWAGADPVLYINGVDPEQLVYISHSGHVSHVPKIEKNKYYADSTYWYAVRKIEKRCGGTSTGTTGSGMLGSVPDAILCQSGNSQIILYSESQNNVSWTDPGRLVYASFTDIGGGHQKMYFNPTTGAYIGTDNTSSAFSSAIAACTAKGNLSNQTGFKFAGVNTVSGSSTPDYESDWITVGASATGTITHNLGVSRFSKFQVIVRQDATHNDEITSDSMEVGKAAFVGAASYNMGITFFVSQSSSPTTQVKYGTGYSAPFYVSGGSGLNWVVSSGGYISSAQMKIRIWK